MAYTASGLGKYEYQVAVIGIWLAKMAIDQMIKWRNVNITCPELLFAVMQCHWPFTFWTTVLKLTVLQ